MCPTHVCAQVYMCVCHIHEHVGTGVCVSRAYANTGLYTHAPHARTHTPVSQGSMWAPTGHMVQGSVRTWFSYLFIYLFIDRGEGREKERGKHQCGCLSCIPTGDLAHNPGMCPGWESNPWSHTSQGHTWFFMLVSLLCAHGFYHLPVYLQGIDRSHSWVNSAYAPGGSKAVLRRAPPYCGADPRQVSSLPAPARV